uniref:Rne/Rng family ribonuclease n=1 Tax=Desertihabitans brevis TaxID=2268447 RepID=UPI0038991D17
MIRYSTFTHVDRRRRAATRPAGTPAPVVPAPTPEPPAPEPVAEQPAPEEEAEDEQAAEATVTEEPVADSTLTEEPVADSTLTEEPATGAPTAETPAAETPAAETPAAEGAPVEPAPTADEKPRRTRGGRGRRRAATEDETAPATTAPTETSAAEPGATGTSATEDAAAATPAPEETEPVEPPTRTRGRRRRPTAGVANPFATPADPAPDAVEDSQDGDEVDPLSVAVRAVFDQADRDGSAETADDEPTTPETAAEATDQDEEPAGAGTAETDEDDDQPRRRRRRRGGRRRRRGAGENDNDNDNGDTDDDEDGDDEPADQEGEDGDDGRTAQQTGAEDGEGEEDSGEQSSGRRRRRRRRRRGEDASGSDDDPSDTVVRVREPRRTSREKTASDQITGIDGSTRLEAKRQRRREGRQSSRRRTPILSEAEFLARRESVERTMVIRQRDDLSQLAVLEDGVLVEHYVDRESATSLIGNVYLGRVQNVLPSMEAAFVDIGRGRNAVLYAGEVDWDAHGAAKSDRQIEKVLKSGQTVLVQVTKDPVGAKGARLTNHVSIPGRYVVYSPGGHLSGISRKLPENERKRLKAILGELVPDEASVIVRTAAEGASEDELVRDVNRLKAQWEQIEKKIRSGSAPQLLYAEPDLTLRIVRDLFTEDFSSLVVDGNAGQNDAYETVESYVGHVAPHLADRLQRWDSEEKGDVFAAHRLDEQIAKALDRKVFLPSGGSLIIDRTEAMTVIDVNTGKFTGSGGNLETTVTSNNLEAAEEIVRQLRLRDIGGIIVIDFIDMVLPSNRELLLRRLVECLGRDRTRHQVAEVTSLGLVQMTRKKIGTGLAEAFTEPCEHCDGLGYHTYETPVQSQHAADGGERTSRKGRSSRNKGGRGRGKKGEQPEEPVKRNGGPQDVYAAMHKDGHPRDDSEDAGTAPADAPQTAAGSDEPALPVAEPATAEAGEPAPAEPVVAEPTPEPAVAGATDAEPVGATEEEPVADPVTAEVVGDPSAADPVAETSPLPGVADAATGETTSEPETPEPASDTRDEQEQEQGPTAG